MKLLLANSTAYPTIGGVENSLLFIAKELMRQGHTVRIMAFRFKQNDPTYIEHDGIPIYRYDRTCERWPHRQFSSISKAAQIAFKDLIRIYTPDAVWSRSAPVGLGIRQAGYKGPLLQIFPTNAKMNCRGLFFHTQGLPLKRRLLFLGLWPLAYTANKNVENSLATQCTAVAFSENMRQQLIKDFPPSVTECHVIFPGVDHTRFSPESGTHYIKTIEKQYGLDRREPYVLYVGRLSTAKNIPLLIRAICKLKDRVKLLLVGSGPEEARLKTFAGKNGVADRVVFVGTQDQMLPGFYAISHVTVLPTIIESFGQVYLESLACGTPAVGFGGDGHRVMTATQEIIRDGFTGSVVAPTTGEALAAGIASILDQNEGDYSTMSRQCREHVVKRFTWRQFVERALALSSKGEEYITKESNGVTT